MTGVVIVDHGSLEAPSNELFLEIVRRFAERHPRLIIEPAHMELAPPTLGEAFDRAVARGAKEIIIHPYFLLPGRHSKTDIPALGEEAARRHPDVPWTVSEPLGLSDLILDVISERIRAARGEQ
jgi:sirohydrochlorin ferrochelatase